MKLLIIDDDKIFAQDLAVMLGSEYKCSIESNGKLVQEALQKNDPDLILLDLMLDDGISGLDLIKEIKQWSALIPIIMITDYSSIDTAIEAIKRGAFNYISKTPSLTELRFVLQQAVKNVRKEEEQHAIIDEINRPYNTIIGNSNIMQELQKKIRLYAENLNTILITGESGVGKELVARQLHNNSDRKHQPFIAINCAAIPSELLESELFGHEKGAFTGASKRKLGKFELAGEGILFLDEISELSPDAQVKILRVIQEREFNRVGGNENIPSKAKLIAATNKDLQVLVQSGRFREDLYYRLDVIPIVVPPLRERKEDIAELGEHFLRESCSEMKVGLKSFNEDSVIKLQNYDWPGNVRQLKNFITRAAILCRDDIISSEFIDIPETSSSKNSNNELLEIPTTRSEMELLRKEAMDRAGRGVEQRYLHALLTQFDGNVSKAADHAGINRTNLHKMMKRCGM